MKSSSRALMGTIAALFATAATVDAQAPAVHLMPLGDSLTEGGYAGATTDTTGAYRKPLFALLQAEAPPFTVNFAGSQANSVPVGETWDGDHEGHPSFTVENIRSRVAFWLKQQPDTDAILLNIGTNDFWSGQTLVNTQARMKLLVEEIAAQRPHAWIIVSTLTPRTDSYAAIQQSFNAWLPGMVANQAALGRKVALADLYTALGGASPDPADLCADLVHPEASGYAKMADGWKPAITSKITPLGNNQAPAIVAVDAREDLQQLKVRFSKPIDLADVIPANFTLSGGLSVTSATLDSGKRLVTLQTSTQAANTPYTLAVSNIDDLFTPANTIAPGSSVSFTSRAVVDGSLENASASWVTTGNVVLDEPNSPAIAADGGKAAIFNGGDTTPDGTVSQNIPTTVGQKYRLQFDMGVASANGHAQSLAVIVENGSVAPGTDVRASETKTMSGIGGGNSIWKTHTIDFTASSNSTTIHFEDASSLTSSVDLLLDDVRIEAVVNDPPLAVDDGSTGTPFRTLYQNSGVSDALAVLENDSDPNSHPLTVTGAASEHGTVTINPGGTLGFTPETDFLGLTSITYVISDGQGGSDSAEVWIEVVAPGTFINGSFEEGTPVLGGALHGWTATGNGTPGDPLVGMPIGYGNLEPNYLALSGNGARFGVFNGGTNDFGGSISQTFNTTPGQTYSVAFFAALGGGAGSRAQTLQVGISSETNAPPAPRSWLITSNGPVASWSEQSFLFVANASSTTLSFTDVSSGSAAQFVDMLLDNVRVTPVTGVPVAANDGTVEAPFVTVAEDSGPFTPIDVLANDSDPESNPLTITAASSPNGTVAINSGLSLGFTPAPDFHGATTIFYTISDGTFTASATVFITVTPVNDPPVAVADLHLTETNAPLNVSAPGVLANDSDVDSPVITASLVSTANGTLTLNADGSFSYTPVTDFTGDDSFTYRTYDGTDYSAPVTVTITVGPAGLLTNGSFEQGEPVNFGTLVGWERLGTLAQPENAKPIGYGTDIPNGYIPSPGNGSRFAVFNPGNDFFGGSISQQFPTTIGQAYQVDFDAGLAAGVGSKNQTLQAALSAEYNPPASPRTWLLTSSGPTATWAAQSFTFIATSTLTTLTFTDASSNVAASRNVDMLLDDVRVTPVGGGNLPPVAVDDGSAETPFLTIAEDSGASASINVLANDTEPQSQPLIVTGAISPNGAVVINGDQTLTYSPAADFNGATTISYTISDGLGGEANATVFISVTPVNDPPVAVADTLAATEDTPVTCPAAALLGNDADVEGSSLLISSVTGAVLNGDGSVTFTPAANFTGDATFSYTVTDGSATSTPATVTVNVAAVNDVPVAVADTLAATEDTPVTYPAAALLGNDTDIEGSTLSIASVTGAVLNGDGSVTFTPALNFTGNTTFTYTITDGLDNSAPATVTVNVAPVNDTPVAVADTLAATEDTPITYPAAALLGNDTDVEGSTLVIASVTGAVLNGDGGVTFTPALNFTGDATFTYTVTDGSENSAPATVTVNVAAVNDAPVANADSLTATEDTPVSYPAAALLGNDTDVEGSALVIAGVTGAVLNGDGSVTYTPAPNFTGDAVFSYTITDGSATSPPATVTVSVSAVNDPPVAVADTLSATEDTPVTYPASALLANDTDVEESALTIASVTGAVLNGDGSVTFTPAENFNGEVTFAYTITDGSETSSPATVTVNVAPVNDAPLAVAGTASIIEDAVATIALSGSDVEGDALTYAIASQPAHGSVDLVGSTVTYTPAPDFNGADSFSFTVSDTQAASSPAVVNITVLPVNDPPVADDLIVTLDEDTSGAANFSGSDAESDSFIFAIITGPAHGTIRLTGTTVDYTPDPDFNGTDTLTYVAISWSGGPQVSSPATVSFVVNPVNDAPSALAQTAATNEDTAIDITLGGNDVDADPLGFAIVTPPVNGTVTLNGAVATYTPNLNSNGPDSFTFAVSDADLTSAPAAVSIAVNPVNDAPLAIAQAVTTTEDAAIEVTLSGSDVENNPLTFTIASQPANGTVTLNGSVATYTPNANSNGQDSFTYSAHDGADNSAPATISVTVSPVNDAPQAIAQAVGTDEDTAVEITLGGSDVENDPLTYAIASQPANGTVTLNGAVATYTPNLNSNGPDSFTFAVSDADLTSAPAAVSITVNPVNDAPQAIAQAVGTAEDTAVEITLGGSDVENDPLTYAIASQPSNGTVTLNGAVATFTPNANSNGPDSFTFTVADAAFTSAPAAVSVTVNSVNDAPQAIAQAVGTDEDTAVEITLGGSDVENDPLTYAIASQPANGTVTLNGAVATYTPNANSNGPDSFTFTVADAELTSAAAAVSITVNPVNDAPQAIAQAVGTAEDTAIEISLSGSDVENDPLTYAIASQPANGTVTLNGAVATFTPNANSNGPDSFTFTVADAGFTSAPAAVSVTVNSVNDAPLAIAQAVSTAEDTAIEITVSGSDVDGDLLTYAIASQPANGTVTLNGALATYTPNLNSNGPDSFTFTVADAGFTSAPAAVSVTVNPVNDAPQAIAQAVSTAEDTALEITLSGSDVENDSLTYAIASQPSNGTVTLNGAVATYTPNANGNGPDSFTFTVADAGFTSAPASVSLTVNPVNDTPVAVADTLEATEDTPATYPVSALLGNDTDIENDSLNVASVTGATLNGDNTITFTPAGNFNGVAGFTYTVTDGNTTSAPAVVTVNVAAVNDAPVATAGSAIVNEDGTVVIALVGTDVDGDTLTYSIVTQPANGIASVSGSNATYQPHPDLNGTDSFTFKAYDGQFDSAPATITVTVTPVDDVPVANPQSVATDEDTQKVITLTGSDVDGDVLFYTVPGTPSHGTLSLSGAQATYTPNPDYHGPDSFTFFTYSIVGGLPVFSAPATVAITVNPVNDTPVALTGSATTDEDAAVLVSLAGTDVDGNPLSYAIATQPSGGSVSLSGNQAGYTPNGNFNGTDSFTFTVNDGSATSVPATVTITVNPINDTPQAVADTRVTDENTPLEVNAPGVLANDSDVENSSLSTQLVTDVSNGTLALAANGGFTYTPASGFSGTDSFSYRVSDGELTSDAVTVTITVNDTASDFDNWLDGFGLTAWPDEDSDGDSISNAVEYVIGGNPANQVDTGLLPTVQTISANLDALPGDEDYLLFTYRRTDLAQADPQTTIGVQWNPLLTGEWAAADGSHGEVIVVEDVPGQDYDLVKVHIPRALAANGRLFARLSVATVSEGPTE